MDLKDLIPKIQQHTKAGWESVKQPALPAPSSSPEQFLQSVNPEDDVSMRSGTSQAPSEPASDPAEHVLAGESQSEDDEEPNLGDFWDSLTTVLMEKMAKDKSNKVSTGNPGADPRASGGVGGQKASTTPTVKKMQTLNVRPPDPSKPPGQSSSGSIHMLRAESSPDQDTSSPEQIQEIQLNFQEPSSNSYHGKTIYEWNIDGESEFGIYKKLHQMMMYATVCHQYSNNDQAIAKFIINGFTGVLKGWWDNIMTPIQQTEILTAIKLELDPTTNQQVQQPDAVYTLIQTIIYHFVGTSTSTQDRGRELLQNLRCPSLTHFRWYKDVFLLKVTQRPDANSTHWKAKFIDGLPTLFAERVRKKLWDRHDRMSIPYEQYTYGQLCSIITDEGLSLCNDLKLHYQMKQQNLTGRKELGEFCEQFAYEPGIKYPNKSRKLSHKKSSKPYRKKSSKTSHPKPTKKFYPKKSTSKSKGKSKSEVKCYKCGQTGHYANRCKSKAKSKVNELNLDPEIKE
ncbi:uncharacterized protein LOC114309755 [Camellia sinensis]|uniref:uncharacterized protein LOC114309755 n=1 Tax=Camellia sinensis TaxID=4442 RepID=UPI0010359CFE|nr:uncharacterized protein LOC114309755 [Camellia sinensis]